MLLYPIDKDDFEKSPKLTPILTSPIKNVQTVVNFTSVYVVL